VVIHRRSGTRRQGPYCRPFHRPPRFHAVAWIPERLWTPFPDSVQRFNEQVRLHAFKNPSWLSWIPSDGTEPFRQLHPLRSFLPPASPFAPTRVAPSQRPILSWTSASLELSPSTPRILNPSWTTRIQTRFEISDFLSDPSPSSEDSGLRPDARSVDPVTRLEGSCNPSSQVSPSQHVKHSNKLVGGFQSSMDQTAPSRRRRSYFPWPWSSGQARLS
jgi:hypothetical protein